MAASRGFRVRDDLLRGLAFLAAVNHSTVTAELERAVEGRLERFGLGMADGQIVPLQAIWEAAQRDGTTGPGL